MAEKFYVTTAIDYVNAAPHIGHAFEKVLADVLARWHRIKGDETFFLTGTDENAQKNEEAAIAAGMKTQEFVDENSKYFVDLCKNLDISNDSFIRTTEEKHKLKSKEIFQKVYDKGEIYKGKYEGLYCKGCEAFLTEKDLIEGKCPEHNKEPELISEDAYFFKLSNYTDRIIEFVENYIVPKSKKNEILVRLKEERLKDLCVSRTNLNWGIDSPIDDKYKIYVWFDALINYISGAKGNWPATVHVVGKGINWFHSVIWPAMLMSAEIELPKKLLVHGYLTFNGQKISKSLGNTIDPTELIKKYSVDAVRYNLLRGSTFEDFDFSEKALVDRHNNELANKLGNLVSRVTGLIEKYGYENTDMKNSKDTVIIERNIALTNMNLFTIDSKMNLYKIGEVALEGANKLIQNFEVDKALSYIFTFVDYCNEYIQYKKPWETKDKKVLGTLINSIKKISILLYPFIPNTCEKIAEKLGDYGFTLEEFNRPLDETAKIKKGEPLFQKIEFKPEEKPNIKKSDEPKEIMDNVTTIQFEDFAKVQLKVAQIKQVEEIENADKLWKLSLDDGSEKGRIICAGIKEFYSAEELKDKKIIIVANLAPRKLRGIESKGMLLAASTKDHSKVSLLTPDKDIEVGTLVG